MLAVDRPERPIEPHLTGNQTLMQRRCWRPGHRCLQACQAVRCVGDRIARATFACPYFFQSLPAPSCDPVLQPLGFFAGGVFGGVGRVGRLFGCGRAQSFHTAICAFGSSSSSSSLESDSLMEYFAQAIAS
jgi:hypothetical protein